MRNRLWSCHPGTCALGNDVFPAFVSISRSEPFMVLFSVIAVGIVWAPDMLPNILEGLPVFCKQGSISGRCLVPPKYDIAIGGVISMRRALRPDFCAAISVVPEPPNGSSTISPRRLQSLIASATRATGLTVGCSVSCSLQGHFAAFARVRADPAASLFRQRDAFCSPASADTHGRGASR
jgi:hypothetical protein